MDYTKIYNDICTRGQSRKLPKDIYSEKHHIIPKCMGGLDDLDNITILTAREHFIAHSLLCKIYPTNYKLAHALYTMSHQQNGYQTRYIPSARQYAYIRENSIKLMKQYWKTNPRKNAMRGKKLSEERKRKLSEYNKKNPTRPMLGKSHTEESKKKMSISWQEKIKNGWTPGPRSQETKDKISKRLKGRSNYWLKGKPGKKHTEETKKKLSKMRHGTQTRGDNHAAIKIKDLSTDIIYSCKQDAKEALNLTQYMLAKYIKEGKFKEI